MKPKLNYAELRRLDTFIRRDLETPLLLVKTLKNVTISEITSSALEQYLGCELEIVAGEMNPSKDSAIYKWLKHFGRI